MTLIDEIIKRDVEDAASSIGDTLEGANVLLTGGAGFIGSWLCDALIHLKARVTCLDNLSSGRMSNIDHIRSERFRFINRDICRFEAEESYDYILHLASIASPEDYERRPDEALLSNSLGSYMVLEAARKGGSTVLFTSSSEVYGDADVIPTPESYWGKVNPVGIRSCYEEAKRFGEALFMAYHRRYGVDVRIARIFNSYGPRIRADGAYARVVPRFIIQALRNQAVTVYGDGYQTRSFCYIADTVKALLLQLEKEKARGESLNIGSPFEVSILELAKKIRETVGSESKITFHPPRLDDPKRRCPNLNKTEKILEWRPQTSLSDGLGKTIKWFRMRAKTNCNEKEL